MELKKFSTVLHIMPLILQPKISVYSLSSNKRQPRHFMQSMYVSSLMCVCVYVCVCVCVCVCMRESVCVLRGVQHYWDMVAWKNGWYHTIVNVLQNYPFRPVSEEQDPCFSRQGITSRRGGISNMC